MISAKEARERTSEIKKKGLAHEISKVEQEIEKAILLGEDSAYLDGSLSSPTREYMHSLGYKVFSGTKYNESYTEIKW